MVFDEVSLIGLRSLIRQLGKAERKGLEVAEETVKDVRKLVQNTDAHIASLTKRVDETLADVQTLAQDVDKQVEPISTEVGQAIKALRLALKQAERTLSAAESVTEEGSPTREKVHEALGELSAAAQSVRALTDYLERHPEALIRGKGGR